MIFKNHFLLGVIISSYFSLLSYEFSCDENNKNNIPQVEVYVNHNACSSNNWSLSANVIAMPDYSGTKTPIHCNLFLYQASPQLKHYFGNVVAPLMYYGAIADHYCALPGYIFSHGLRQCLHDLSQFISSDALLIPKFIDRLEAYCTRIETVLFNGENHAFCENLSHKDQVALIHAYADFLKEFYPGSAQCLYNNLSQKNPLMQQVKQEINWKYYDGRNVESSVRDKDLRNAASVHSNLGAVYKALYEGDIEKAYIVGQECIKTVVSGRLIGKTSKMTSVFEKYPALQQKVTQAYDAHKVKAESYSVKATKDKQEKDQQQKTAVVQAECSEHTLAKLHFDTIQKRYDAATYTILNSQCVKQLHKVSVAQAHCFATDHLTSDQKGILFDGNRLQHHLVDEAITVVDVVVSDNLVENVHDAVIDLANASVSLNKNGDVVMASRTLDACWALVDFAKDAARYTYSALSTHVPLIAKGTCDGVCESLHGAVHAVCHPVETAQDVANSFVVAGYYLGKLAYANCVCEVAADVLETDPKRYEHMIQQYAIEPATLMAIYEYAEKNNVTEDIARVGTKAVVDMMLLHGVTKAVSAITQESLPTFLSCMRKGGESAEVVMTAEGVPVRCAEEVACIMEKIENANTKITIEAIDIGTKNAAAKIEKAIELPNAAVKKYGKQSSPYQKNSKPIQHERPLNRLEGKDLLGIDNIVMSGYGPLPKSISLDNYKHYLQPELRITSKGKIKPSGWHHDPGRRIEAIKRINGHKIEIELYEKHKSGIYKFYWGVEGGKYKKPSTFFPYIWSREIIQQKIIEAYKYARKYKVEPIFQADTGNFLLHGFTSEYIKIEMIINTKGQLITAYPIFPK